MDNGTDAATALAFSQGWFAAFEQAQKVLATMMAEFERTEDAAPLGNPMKSVAFGQRIGLLAAAETLSRIAAGHMQVQVSR